MRTPRKDVQALSFLFAEHLLCARFKVKLGTNYYITMQSYYPPVKKEKALYVTDVELYQAIKCRTVCAM